MRLAFVILMVCTWVLIASSIYSTLERNAAIDQCLTQSERALDAARSCDQALEWCLGELRVAHDGRLRQNLSGR